MRGYEIFKRWQALSDYEREYAIGFMTGTLSMEDEGFAYERPHKEHASFALDVLEKSITQAVFAKDRHAAEDCRRAVDADGDPVCRVPGCNGDCSRH